MPKISAKQVADAKATMELIQTRANDGQIPDEEWNAAVDRYNAAKAIVAASEITPDQKSQSASSPTERKFKAQPS